MSQEHFSPSNAVAADFQQVLGKYMVCNLQLYSQTLLVLQLTNQLGIMS